MRLLENLTVVSKNPSYYPSEVEALALTTLQTRIIPRDKLILHEEVGEGAFGKVFKGELISWKRFYFSFGMTAITLNLKE